MRVNGRHDRPDLHAVLDVSTGAFRDQGTQGAVGRKLGIGNKEGASHKVFLQHFKDTGAKSIQTDAIFCLDRNSVVRQRRKIVQPVALIIDDQIGRRKAHPADGLQRCLLFHLVLTCCIAYDEGKVAPESAFER